MRQIKQYLAAGTIILGCLIGPAANAEGVAPVLGDLALGKADAPVTVIEYASLTCPHCAHFAIETFDKVKAAYIDTGKVKWIYRDFPLDEMALRAAMMARCGGADRYYGFVDIIFKQQQSWATQKDPLQALAQLGRLGGIGDTEFKACMTNQQVENAVLQSSLNAKKEFDVDSTPSFIVNGKKQSGALDFDAFSKVIDALLPTAAAAPVASNAPANPGAPAAPTADNGKTTWIIGAGIVIVVLVAAGVLFARRKSAG
jgi:protein-disulfide isomerase